MQNASADITRPPSHCEARRCHHRRPPAEGLRSPDPRADSDDCNRTAQRHPSPDQPRAGPSLRQDSQTTLIRSATTRPITSEVLPAADGTKPKNLGALQIAMRISPSRYISRGVLHTCPGLAERRTSMGRHLGRGLPHGAAIAQQSSLSRVLNKWVAAVSRCGRFPVGFRSASGIHGIMQPS